MRSGRRSRADGTTDSDRGEQDAAQDWRGAHLVEFTCLSDVYGDRGMPGGRNRIGQPSLEP